MKPIKLTIVLVFISNLLLAQTATQVFEDYMNTKKNEKEYQVDINYALYKGIEGEKAYESYGGIQAKYNDVIYQNLGEMELAQGVDFMVKLNTSEKAMLVALSSEPVFQNFNQLDNDNVLKLFEDKTVEDNGDKWKITLTSKLSVLSQFSKIELYVKKENFQLVKQKMYYASISDFSTYDKNKKEPEFGIPILEIKYKNYKSSVTLNKEFFNKSRYFLYENNQITASKTYKDFEILYAN